MTAEKPKNLQILEAIAVAAELSGTEFSDVAKVAMVEELTVYPLEDVKNALKRCGRELTGRLTLAAILERIDTGLPSADEAWGLLLEGLQDERLTVVIPEIAQQASGNGASELFYAGDKTGARMAFKDAYNRLAGALDKSKGIKWVVSRGYDAEHAKTAITEAVRKGLLDKHTALQALPFIAQEERVEIETGKVLALEERQEGIRKISEIRALLASKKVGAL